MAVRVFLLVFPSALFMPPVVEHVVVSGQFEVIGVGGFSPRKRGSAGAWLRDQIDYWGLWGSAWIIGATILRKLPSLFHFPRAFRRLSSVAETCDALDIPYERVADVNDPAFVARLREAGVDVIVSFQQAIFKRELLQVPTIACLNVHTGILPGYRGFKPIFWMQSRGEPELGVTIHVMNERIDTGEVVAQRRWRRRDRSSVLENQLWSYRCAAQCIVEAVERIAQVAPRQNVEIPDDSPYFKAPTRGERDHALANGTRLL